LSEGVVIVAAAIVVVVVVVVIVVVQNLYWHWNLHRTPFFKIQVTIKWHFKVCWWMMGKFCILMLWGIFLY